MLEINSVIMATGKVKAIQAYVEEEIVLK